MPVPNIYEDGSAVHGTGALSVPWGTHNAQFHAVMLITSAGQTISPPTSSDTTWTLIAEAYEGTPGAAGSIGIAAYWAPSTSDGGMTNATVPDTGDHTSAKMWMLQNVLPAGTGNPINMSATQTVAVATAAISMASPPTTVANCLVMMAAGHAIDTGTNPGGSGWANAALDSIGFNGQYTTTNGVGGGYMGAQGEKAAAGACGTFTHNWSGGSTKQANLIWAISDTATVGGADELEPLPGAANAGTNPTPTMTAGAVSTTGAPGAADAGTNPTPTLTNVSSVAPLPGSADAQGVNPTLTAGAVSVTAAPGAGDAQGVDPTLTAGSSTVTADPGAATATGVIPTLTAGAVSIAPDPGGAVAAGVDPAFQGESEALEPDPGTGTGTGVDPSLTPGAVTMTADPGAATATGVDPAIDAGAATATADPGAATAAGVDPTLTAGALSIAPDPGSASATGVDPTTVNDGADLAADPATASAQGVAPTWTPGAVVITADPASASAIGVNPVAAPGSAMPQVFTLRLVDVPLAVTLRDAGPTVVLRDVPLTVELVS